MPAKCKPIRQSCLIANPTLCLCCCVMGNSSHSINWRSSHLFLKAASLNLEHFVIPGTTVILGAVAVAMLGSRCNAVTLMVLNLAATPIELRYTQSISWWPKPISDHLDTYQCLKSLWGHCISFRGEAKHMGLRILQALLNLTEYIIKFFPAPIISFFLLYNSTETCFWHEYWLYISGVGL